MTLICSGQFRVPRVGRQVPAQELIQPEYMCMDPELYRMQLEYASQSDESVDPTTPYLLSQPHQVPLAVSGPLNSMWIRATFPLRNEPSVDSSSTKLHDDSPAKPRSIPIVADKPWLEGKAYGRSTT